ncbi:pre-rRNA-processing protein TSR2 homolog [Lycorma delicatula]|uniref:pre-rRNA-processing protein TSR2 homolog n=1 Tax=Lycorma delicatula TaxID=130591 RepID=UPI003F51775B
MDNLNTIEEKLKEVTGIIFNNWYALKIVLEHGQGGPRGVQNCKIQNFLSSITSMVTSSKDNNLNDISDFIYDFMDDEFDTVLEDDSHLQVAKEICDLYKLLLTGNSLDVNNRIGNLPNKNSILTCNFNTVLNQNQVKDSSSDDDDDCGDGCSGNNNDISMEQDDVDPGWTVVKHNRRK